MILECPREAIGSPLGTLGPRWDTFGSPVASLFEERYMKKHFLEAATFRVHISIDFGAKLGRADLELDIVFTDRNACAPFSRR